MAKRSELLKDWLELLRSGQFSQTREVLKNDEGYCCLGVAAEGLFNVEWEETNDGWYEYKVDDEWACDNTLIPSHAQEMSLDLHISDDESVVLKGITSYIIQEWDAAAQQNILEEIDNMFSKSSRENWLIHLNDNGFSFEDIANFVTLAGWIPQAEQEERIEELTQKLEVV